MIYFIDRDSRELLFQDNSKTVPEKHSRIVFDDGIEKTSKVYEVVGFVYKYSRWLDEPNDLDSECEGLSVVTVVVVEISE